MIKECVDVYERHKSGLGCKNLVLNNHIPNDGTYIFVEIGENDFRIKDTLAVKYDKKKDDVNVKLHEMYPLLCFCDYSSKLVNMQKPMDKKKTIQSNNYLSFIVRQDCVKEKKLTEEIIDGYYDALKNPAENKYKGKKNTYQVYRNVEDRIGPPDTELLERIRSWVKSNVYDIMAGLKAGKDFLKIFFIFPDEKETRMAYSRERERYFIPNVYNSNDYNRVINGITYGVPNNDISLNAKKPYLCTRTRKTEIPYMVDTEEVLKQHEFYEYLGILASSGRNSVYFDINEGKVIACRRGESPDCTINGYVMWVEKGKLGPNVYSIDTVTGYNPNMRPTFTYKEIIKSRNADAYGMINRLDRLESLIDEIFFFKMLKGNYFSSPESFPSTMDGIVIYNLLRSRDMLFTWLHRGGNPDIAKLLDTVTEDLVLNSIRKGYWGKVVEQLNLRWSLIDYFSGDKRMEECMMNVREALEGHILQKGYWSFENDDEFYYGVGQMVAFFLSKNRSKNKPLSLVNPFLQCNSADKLKMLLEKMFIKYNHAMTDKDVRAKNLYGAIMMYKPETKPDTHLISAGFVSPNVIYIKSEDTNETEEE